MNQNTNKLPRRKVSKNKNLGKVDNSKINFNLITDPSNVVTDGSFGYYPSKFQFSDFYNKDIQPYSWISKPKFLLKEKGGKLYRTDKTGLELAFLHLCSLYQDLDTCLQRLYDGYHDSMFIRFATQSGIFTTEEHWLYLLRNYEEAFCTAVRRYYVNCHPKYDAGSNLSYVTYFDTHFSNYLYYALSSNDQQYHTMSSTVPNREKEHIKLDHIDEQECQITYLPEVYSSWLM